MSEDRIVQRWRKPVRPMAVKDNYDWASADLGRETMDYSARFSPDDTERIRLGYVCIRCWEPHETPMPESCALCGFPIREEQAAEFHQKFQGEERDPRAVLIEKELDRVDDKHERNYHVTKTGIVIPKQVR